MRRPIVEGIFYPSDKTELEKLIASYIENKERKKAQIILSPHAGYNTAGQQIGDAFLAAAGKKVEEIIIISPVHREEQDTIILPYFTKFSTVAGELEINMKSLHLFKGNDPSIIRDDVPHLEEHAIEDQLPFITTLFPGVKILPVLLGKTTISLIKKLTAALQRAYGPDPDNVLFVVTSNLSNYEKKESALSKADRALEIFKAGNWRDICEEKRTGLINACGAGALAGLLALYSRPFTMTTLSRSISEGRESEKGKIVSYGALSFELKESD